MTVATFHFVVGLIKCMFELADLFVTIIKYLIYVLKYVKNLKAFVLVLYCL